MEPIPQRPLLAHRLRKGVIVGLLALVLGSVPGRAAPAPSLPELPPLASAGEKKRLPGKFVWADLVTDDLPGAQKFYGDLLGWTFVRIHDGYLLAAHQDRWLAGLVHRPRPAGRQAQPRWFGYISVPNLANAMRVVTNAGGRVVAPPEKLHRRGEQAVFTDAEGAAFGLIRSERGDPADFQAQPGEWIWIQLMSRDARTASEFYSRVAGYRIVENTTPNRLSDFVLTSQGYARATVRALPAEAEARPTWLLFVRVASLPDAVSRSVALGGRVMVEPRAELLGGRVAVILDPAGAPLGLFEWSDDLVKKGRP